MERQVQKQSMTNVRCTANAYTAVHNVKLPSLNNF